MLYPPKKDCHIHGFNAEPSCQVLSRYNYLEPGGPRSGPTSRKNRTVCENPWRSPPEIVGGWDEVLTLMTISDCKSRGVVFSRILLVSSYGNGHSYRIRGDEEIFIQKFDDDPEFRAIFLGFTIGRLWTHEPLKTIYVYVYIYIYVTMLQHWWILDDFLHMKITIHKNLVYIYIYIQSQGLYYIKYIYMNM